MPDSEAVAEAEKPLYWPELDGLRFMAFFLVFLRHIQPFPSEVFQAFSVEKLAAVFLKTFMLWGWVGVDMFFTLSGFLITSLLLKEREKFGRASFKLFFVRRMLRIWPLYYFALLLAFFILPFTDRMHLMGLGIGQPEWVNMVKVYLVPHLFFVANFLFLEGAVIKITPFLPSLWSVAIEEQFYVAWGALFSRMKSMRWLYVAIAAGLVAAILFRLQVIPGRMHTAYYLHTLGHLDPLLIGALAACLLHQKILKPELLQKLGFWLFVLPVTFYLFCMFCIPPIESNSPVFGYLMTVIALCSLAFMLAAQYWAPLKIIFLWRPFNYFGRLTYGMYVYHELAIDCARWLAVWIFGAAIEQRLQIIPSWVFILVFSFLITWLFAWLSWHLLEKRFHSMRRRFSPVPSGFATSAPAA